MTKIKKKSFFFQKKNYFYWKLLKFLLNVFFLLYKDQTMKFEENYLKNIGQNRF